MSLLTDLDAFYTDHRHCGDLDAGVNGPVVWFDYECGARIARSPRRSARRLSRRRGCGGSGHSMSASITSPHRSNLSLAASDT